MRIIIGFQVPTFLYTVAHHLVPYMLSDYTPWQQYYMKVLFYFIVVNVITNYLCMSLYDPSYPKSKDNPYLTLNETPENVPDTFIARIENSIGNGPPSSNSHYIYDMTSKTGLPWFYCEKCQMYVPPRTYHCKFCRLCVMKRDHHCYIVGKCVGFKNQRFFIMMTFYAMMVGGLGGYYTLAYVRAFVWPVLYSWTDLIFPVTIIRWIFGYVQGLHCILIIHLYTNLLFLALGLSYFPSQMVLMTDGRTVFEEFKKIPIKINNTFSQNLKSVFGDFWALNFIFPMVLILRQRDDGIHWENVKIDHNANEKWKNDKSLI